MTSPNQSKLQEQQQEIRLLIQHINNCWRENRPDGLSDYFHEDVVFNAPDFKHQVTGKENCIRTYIDFMNQSSVSEYAESNFNVRLFDKTAIATYDFEMTYQQQGKTYHERGTDILVFEQEGQSWKVIWRALSNLSNS